MTAVHPVTTPTRAARAAAAGGSRAGTAADAARAIKAAEVAFPAWRATPAPKRGEIMYGFAELLARHKERLARAMTREMGKVLAEARGDVQEGIDIAYLMAGEGRRPFRPALPGVPPPARGAAGRGAAAAAPRGTRQAPLPRGRTL